MRRHFQRGIADPDPMRASFSLSPSLFSRMPTVYLRNPLWAVDAAAYFTLTTSAWHDR
jgi:hypothetical protein